MPVFSALFAPVDCIVVRVVVNDRRLWFGELNVLPPPPPAPSILLTAPPPVFVVAVLLYPLRNVSGLVLTVGAALRLCPSRSCVRPDRMLPSSVAVLRLLVAKDKAPSMLLRGEALGTKPDAGYGLFLMPLAFLCFELSNEPPRILREPAWSFVLRVAILFTQSVNGLLLFERST